MASSSLLIGVWMLFGTLDSQDVDSRPEENFGAETNPTGDPIGGGQGYRDILEPDEAMVRTAEALLEALADAKRGDVVFVAGNAEIDLTAHREIVIPQGVTLASDRGKDDSEGALLFSRLDKKTPPGKAERFTLFETGGGDVRVTGLRLRGPDPKRRNRYEYLNSDGVLGRHDGLVIDNCELWGWSHGAVYLVSGKEAHVHHNDIHHCQRRGLGYGVVINKAEVLIEANRFDWCRHAIAATGRSPSGYEARYNWVGENANGHSFDMHGGRDRKDGTNVAGDWMKIHHNTFLAPVIPVVIRGTPTQKATIHHNWFVGVKTPGRAVVQKNSQGNVEVYENQYTKDRIVK